MGTFTLPETRAAFDRWQDITGLDEDSPEWGEVLAVLRDTDLLAADRAAQRHLFEDPAAPLGDTEQVRALRLAIVGGAQFHRDQTPAGSPLGLAMATAVVATLIQRHYGEDITGLPVEQGLYLLEREVDVRTMGVTVSPAVALKWLMPRSFAPDSGGVDRDSMVGVVVDTAWDNDEFAVAVFDRLAENRHHHVALAPMCTGAWLVYDCAQRL